MLGIEAAPGSAVPGTGIAIPAPAAMSKVSTTPTLSTMTCRTAGPGPSVSRRSPRSWRISIMSPTASTYAATTGSTPKWSARGSKRGEWEVRTSAGDSLRGRFLLCATGCLSAVNRPDLPGLDDFAGEVFYTANWPRDDPDLRGKKIGVIGTGSSGIQAVPILAEEAESLMVFQRSPNYSVPMPNRPWTDDDLQRIRREYPERAPLGVRAGGYPA